MLIGIAYPWTSSLLRYFHRAPQFHGRISNILGLFYVQDGVKINKNFIVSSRERENKTIMTGRSERTVGSDVA